MYKFVIKYDMSPENGTLYAVVECVECDRFSEEHGNIHNLNVFDLASTYVRGHLVEITNYAANKAGLKDLKNEVTRVINRAETLIERRRFAEYEFKSFIEEVEV